MKEIFLEVNLKTLGIKQKNKQNIKGRIKDPELYIKVLNLDMNKLELKG